MVPGIGPSPDKMLLGRLFSYPDTHRYRIGTNYLQLPINQPQSPVHSYNKDGSMRYRDNGAQPVYAPNTFGGPHADKSLEEPSWFTSGEMTRSPYELHAEDDDFAQPRELWTKVLSDTDRAHLVSNLVAHLKMDVRSDIVARALEYWRNVHPDIADGIAKGMGIPAAHAGDGARTGA
jgi:catalase